MVVELMIKGFVLDFDGLILDTEIPRFTSWKEVFEENGFPLTYKDWGKTIGTGPTAYDPGKHLVELTRGKLDYQELRKRTNARALELLQKQTLLPGVEEFIFRSHQMGIPMAVASSSNREWVLLHLERFDLLKYFEGVFGAQDVACVKPDPELYQLALNKIKVPADSALAFEDSPNGIRAAKSAGMACIAVPNQITREMDLSQADRIIDSFERISPEELQNKL